MDRSVESSSQKGSVGEQHAVEFLLRAGYRILARNYRTGRGEVDIIAGDGPTVVFIEVKCWKAVGMEDLEISVNRRKQRRIIEASRVYLMRQGLTDRVSVRYDLVFVGGDSMQVHHVPDAFTESTWSG